MFLSIRRYWRSLGIVKKFAITMGGMLVLMALVGGISYLSLGIIRDKVNSVIGKSMRVQRVVQDIDAEFQRARQAERGFFLGWRDEGYEAAREAYVEPCREHIGKMMLKIAELEELLLAPENRGTSANRLVHTRFLVEASEVFSRTLLEGVRLVGVLASPQDGLRPMLAQQLGRVRAMFGEGGSKELLPFYLEIEVAAARLLALQTPEAQEGLTKALEELRDKMRSVVGADVELMSEMDSGLERIGTMGGEIVRAARNLQHMKQQFGVQTAAIEPVIKTLIAQAHDDVEGTEESVVASHKLATIVIGTSLAVALLLAGSIFLLMIKAVSSKVQTLVGAADAIQRGNFESRVIIRGKDEFAVLGESFNRMADRLQEQVAELEDQAEAAGNRLVEAIESLGEGFALYDAEDRLVLLNSRFREFFQEIERDLKPGMFFEDMVRVAVKKGLYPDALGREEEFVRERMEQHRTPGQAVELGLGGGRWLRVSEYRTASGEITSIISEETRRHNAERELAKVNASLEERVRSRTRDLLRKTRALETANTRLKEMDENKSMFLATVSHEIRTPLTSLLGFSKLIRKDFDKFFAGTADEQSGQKAERRIGSNLDIIFKEGERLTRLINDVLDLNRIETGRMEWHDREVDIADILDDAIRAVSGQFAEKRHVALRKRRVESLPKLNVDPDRMLQVFLNLLNNAAKYTDKGEVNLDAFVDNDGNIRIQVEDTGTGIPQEFLELVFDKFQQARNDDTLREKHMSSGLGLSICRQVVVHYGGRIWVESEPGEGATFIIVLPGPNRNHLVSSIHRDSLILVVDDDLAARELLRRSLEMEGYVVITAENGQEALDMASQYRPDLISMDLEMPVMDGRTAIEKLRRDTRLSKTPILVVSVASDFEISGGDAALAKPIDANLYTDAVHGLIGKKRAKHPMIAVNGANERIEDQVTIIAGPVDHCTEDELWARLTFGFTGTVIIPEGFAEPKRLEALAGFPGIQVLMLPTTKDE